MKTSSFPSARPPHSLAARRYSSLEALEQRIAPAAILTLTDVDGDTITIKTSKGTNADLTMGPTGVVQTSAPLGSVMGGVQIDTIDLTKNAIFDGTDLTVTAKRGAGPNGAGDGLVNVGYVKATGFDLGTVTIGGDLQRITAGKTGGSIAAINVNSTSGILVSTILGSVGTLNVKHDFRGMELHVDEGGAKIGLLKIGDSLVGEGQPKTGYISVAMGSITTLTIGGDIIGGPTAADAGEIVAKDIGTATVSGSILGHSGSNGARIAATTSLLSLLVKGDVIGGAGANSGLIHGDLKLGNITINGSLLGGAGGHSGTIEGTTGVGNVKIGRDQKGGSSNDTGDIQSSGGGIGTVTIGGSVIGGSFSSSGRIVALGGMQPGSGNIGAIKIGGDLVSVAHDSTNTLLTDSGIIFAQNGTFFDGPTSNIASINIGGSVVGGGNSANAGYQITADGTIGPVTIGRDLRGGEGVGSGSIGAGGGLTTLTIGGDIVGGSAGSLAGAIVTKSITSATVGGNIIGKAGPDGGKINVSTSLGSLLVKGSVIGGAGNNSGLIHSNATLGAITVNGSLLGGGGTHSGTIEGFTGIGNVKIGHDQKGGSNSDTGDIQSSTGGLGTVTIGGSVIGGTASFSGRILATGGDMGAIKIGGDLVSVARDAAGTQLTDTGLIYGQVGTFVDGPNCKLTSLTIGGSVVGGSGNAKFQITIDGTIGPVKIGRDLRGGESIGSGSIVGSSITSVTIGGSVAGGSANAAGLIQTSSGLLGPVQITGSLLGGGGTLAGAISAAAGVSSITIGGDLASGTGASSGAITVNGIAGAISIGRNIIGNATVNASISATPTVGVGSQLAIKSLTVGGWVEFAQINAGGATNGDAQIGAVTVKGDWIASNIVTGIDDGADNVYGTADDTALAAGMSTLFSKIASITIGGRVAGTDSGADHFGFVSQEIGKLTINGQTVQLKAGRSNDTSVTAPQYILGTTQSTLNMVVLRDFTVHEVL